jgi:hypothetical protein
MMDAIQVWPQLMSVAGDLVAKAQDWPGADELADRLKKTIPPQLLDEKDGGPPPVPAAQVQAMQQAAQQTIIQLQTENQELKMDKTLEFKKLEIQSYDAETKRISALNQDRGTEGVDDLEALKLLLTGAQKLDEHDIQRQQMAHNQKMDVAKHTLAQTQAENSQEIALKGLSQKAAQPASPGGQSSAQP